MSDRVYLDWNATAPLRPEARKAMAAAWDLCGNPSSVHAEGRRARKLIEDARAGLYGGGPPTVECFPALRKMPFYNNVMNAEPVTLSGAKIGGPKGVGAVVPAEGVLGLEPLLRGGGQELRRRAGTENVAG